MGEYMHSYQKRHNYLYKNVELALKWSKAWGYHLELEIVIDDYNKQKKAELKIKKVADKLGVKIMSEEEITKLSKKVDENYRKGVYK